MGVPKRKPRFTFDQYLKIERAAEERHLYLDGEISSMASESIHHSYISVKLVVMLASYLKETPYSILTKGMKVRSSPVDSSGAATTGMFCYPDILILCGEPEFHDSLRDVILNPKVIIEVLSDSTEAFDRGKKFERYQRWNPSLTDYLLVSQDEPKIDHFRRIKDGAWNYQIVRGLEAILQSTRSHVRSSSPTSITV